MASPCVSVVYFAVARELAGCASEELELASELGDASALVAWLGSHKPQLAPHLSRMRFAINGELTRDPIRVRAGDEITVLPPVAGGSEARAPLARVSDAPLSIDEVVAHVQHPGAGALVVFIGTVRDHADGKAVAKLDYEAAPELAHKEMLRILQEIERELDVVRLAVVHRVGALALGELAVVLAASAPHRAEAFEAARVAIERIKQTVPIWKKEWAPDGSALWVNFDAPG